MEGGGIEGGRRRGFPSLDLLALTNGEAALSLQLII
jgi:hypothetical protein